MAKLSDKVALITGANSGIGLETAKEFAREGARVVITGRRQGALDEAVHEVGHGAVGVQGDVAKLGDLDRLYAEVKRKFGRIDILFANAGHGTLAPFAEVSEEQFDSQFDVNVKGVYFTVQKALPLLRDGASVILTSSVAGVKGFDGFSVYSATKAAVRSFARTWASELKDRQIRVNVISPGPIETPIFGKMGLTQEQAASFGENIATQVPLGRIGQPHEIAKAALFLASSDSSYVTGVDLFVDGGMAQI